MRGSNSRHSGCKPDARTSWANCPKKAGSYLLSRNESSIIGVRELDFRVRNGNGYYLSTMATSIINNARTKSVSLISQSTQDGIFTTLYVERKRWYGQVSRLISNARLNASRRLHLHPINLVVSQESSGNLKFQGSLILRWASRLDAFSGYPFRT